MKLFLINPYFGQGKNWKTEGATYSPPLGLGFLGTFIRDKSNCEVEIIDPRPQKLDAEDVLAKIKNAEANCIVGLACFTDTRFYCFDFAEKIKEIRTDCKLILGGPHVYCLEKKILEYYPFIDFIVTGEGEQTLLEVINGKPLSEINGITWRNGKEIIKNPARAFMKNIDDLYVDYSLLPDLDKYEPDVEAPDTLRGLRNIYLITSRGCPFQCTYCANEHWQRTWRAESAKTVVDRMELYIKKYNVQYFRFYDDLFTADTKRVFEFCNLLKERKLNINFRVLVRAGTKRECLEVLKEVGCKSVGFGIESGSNKILKRIKKGINREQLIETIKTCKEIGLWAVGSFIISLPDETMDDIKESFSLMSLLDSYQTNIQIVYPYTPFYKELKENGEINDDVWFDRNMEGKILYSKDTFKSARFYFKDLQWILLNSQYYFFRHNPVQVIQRYGFIKGILRVILGYIDTPFKGNIFKTTRNLLRKLGLVHSGSI